MSGVDFLFLFANDFGDNLILREKYEEKIAFRRRNGDIGGQYI